MIDKLNKIANQDCLEYLKELPDRCVVDFESDCKNDVDVNDGLQYDLFDEKWSS